VRPVASPDPDTLDQASLERFQTQLIEAGFEPVDGDRSRWRGPITDELCAHTAAATMDIVFVDGWPFQHPRLIVEGLDADHVGADDQVCLWAAGARSDQWLTWDGYRARIAEWATRVRDGFQVEDFALDGHLSFERHKDGIATVQLTSLPLDDAQGRLGRIVASWDKPHERLTTEPGRSGAIEGRWYLIERRPSRRPKNLDEVRALLSPRQQTNLDRRLAAVRDRGMTHVILVAWDRDFGRDALLLLAEKDGGKVNVSAIELAPTDVEVLKLRAGPDVDALSSKCVLLFGAGAIGSHAAVILAECGVGKIILFDRERLRPGNVVRHVAGSISIASHKVHATGMEIFMHAPWTKVREVVRADWNAETLAKYAEAGDVLVDATGLASFTLLLAHIADRTKTPLVSTALYREGAIGRVRRQALESDTPIWLREPPDYPVIPAGAGETPRFETGCSSPVNNASPLAVHTMAATLGESVIDLLTARNLHGDERIVVFRPLDEPPFDQIGTLS
jgi:hypothetical protein